MENKNETVKDIAKEMRNNSNKMVGTFLGTDFGLENFANRIEAAHRRDVEEKMNAITRRYEQLKTQCLKICGKRECDNRGVKCIQCAKPVLDFLIRGKSEGAAK